MNTGNEKRKITIENKRGAKQLYGKDVTDNNRKQ
jgi:hypothetical protein